MHLNRQCFSTNTFSIEIGYKDCVLLIPLAFVDEQFNYSKEKHNLPTHTVVVFTCDSHDVNIPSSYHGFFCMCVVRKPYQVKKMFSKTVTAWILAMILLSPRLRSCASFAACN